MARFSCPDCRSRSNSAIGCRRCGSTTGRQVQHCPIHGARCLHGCRMCRSLIRSYAGS